MSFFLSVAVATVISTVVAVETSNFLYRRRKNRWEDNNSVTPTSEPKHRKSKHEEDNDA